MKKLVSVVISGMFLVSAAGCATYGTKTTTKTPTGTNQGVTRTTNYGPYGQRTGLNVGTGTYNRTIGYATPGTYGYNGTNTGYGMNTGIGTNTGVGTSTGIGANTGLGYNRIGTNYGAMQGITSSQAINKAVTNAAKTKTHAKAKAKAKAKPKTVTKTMIKKITTVKKGNTTTTTETILKNK